MINVRPLYRLHAIDYISSQTLRDLFFISTKLNLADTKCKGTKYTITESGIAKAGTSAIVMN